MCGIWARFGQQPEDESAEFWTNKLRARGPEKTLVKSTYKYTMGFTRLAINGLNEAGMQPMNFGSTTYMCNGEIYNWVNLASRHGVENSSGSDCEVLGELWEKFSTVGSGSSFFQSLDGVFSIIIADSASDHVYVARDPYGVRPLFVGYKFGEPVSVTDVTKSYVQSGDSFLPIVGLYFASEMKALLMCNHIEVFPPGHCAAYNMSTLGRTGFEQYHSVPWLKNPIYETPLHSMLALKVALKDAVNKRMMTDRPVAALLSGGLDSSLIAALVQKNLKEAGAKPLKTFSIGFEGSEDLRCARLVADHIGSEHHEILMSPDEFFDSIPDVIRDIESYDITTVRASVGNWLVAKAIAETTDCKVVFNGDGSDEVFGSYKYFYGAPSDEAFEVESGRLLKDIHYFDVLRSDRSISSHGLEARTPFLDKQFVGVARSISTDCRRPSSDRLEKWILREAFFETGLLPEEVLYRKKEAFSDGVSGPKSWFEICKEKSEAIVSGDMPWQARALLEKYTHLPPTTAEAYYYRWLFEKTYKGFEAVTVPYYWMPKWSKTNDPSARTLS